MTTLPKFTILIPTRERAETLRYALQSACTQDYKNLEIIVSDNFSLDNTRTVVEGFNDSRVRYINTGKRLSMSHNWEFALSHVKEGWVTILGDDDAILPGSIQRVIEVAEKTGVKAVCSNSCYYQWPSLFNKSFGYLNISLSKGYEIRNSKKWLEKVVDGKESYTSLPVLYNSGFVDIEVIHKAKIITGDFYRSMTPDVYSAIAISHIIDDYVYCHEPLSINGASKHSGGTSVFSPGNLIDKKDSPAMKYLSEPNISFHADLPLMDDGTPPISIQALFYEAYLQALPLTKYRDPCANHQRQLAIILKSRGEHSESLMRWARVFGKFHNLDIPSTNKPMVYELIEKNFAKLNSVLFSLNTYILIGTSNCPLRNVYDASIAASALKIARPSRVRGIFERIRRKIVVDRGLA